ELDKLSAECGMIFEDFELRNTNSHLSVSTGQKALFLESGTLKKEDLTLHLVTHYREETVDDTTPSSRSGSEIITEDHYLDPDKDIIIEKNEDGYTYSIENADWDYGFYIYAEEGSAAIKNEYVHIPDIKDGYFNPKDKENDRKLLMTWVEQDDGTYALSESTHRTIPLFTDSGMLLISE
nr:hypothetical protein [Lachnospiraceae bacterium]